MSATATAETFGVNLSDDVFEVLDKQLAEAEAAESQGLNKEGDQSAPAKQDVDDAALEAQQSEQSDDNSGTQDATQKTKTEENPKTEAKPEAKKEDAKPTEKEASKFAKEQQRRDNSWKALNEEKTKFQQERELLVKEREAFERRKEAEKLAVKTITPEQFETAAEAFEEQGDYDKAKAARLKAKELRANPPKDPLTDAQEQSFARGRQRFPQMFTKDTPENKLAIEIANKFPELTQFSPNPSEVLEVMVKREFEINAKATAQASRVPELESQVATLQARIKELEQATAPAGGGSVSSQPKSDKPFEEMTEAEQERWLRQNVL